MEYAMEGLGGGSESKMLHTVYIQLLVAALYTRPELCLNTLANTSPPDTVTSGLEWFLDEWLQDIKELRG